MKHGIATAGFILATGSVILGCAAAAGGSRAAAPETLAGGAWRIERIGAQAVVDPSRTAMRFAADGRVTGGTGCNRFTGTATLGHGTVTFSPLAMTRMACQGELSDQESRFVAAIDRVRRWTVEADGALVLSDAAGQALMRLSAAPATPE